MCIFNTIITALSSGFVLKLLTILSTLILHFHCYSTTVIKLTLNLGHNITDKVTVPSWFTLSMVISCSSFCSSLCQINYVISHNPLHLFSLPFKLYLQSFAPARSSTTKPSNFPAFPDRFLELNRILNCVLDSVLMLTYGLVWICLLLFCHLWPPRLCTSFGPRTLSSHNAL